MFESRLDPVVEKTLEVTLAQVNTDTLHPNDYERWMCLFPALIAAGYTWDINHIYGWLDEHWPGLPDERGMNHQNAIKVYAWADMALHQCNPSDWEQWAEGTIQVARDELAQ